MTIRNQRDLINAYADETESSGKASGLWFEVATIYSYGTHFPLAFRQADGSYLVNRDKYSMTTSHHQSAVFGALARRGAVLVDSDTRSMRERTGYKPDLLGGHLPEETLRYGLTRPVR